MQSVASRYVGEARLCGIQKQPVTVRHVLLYLQQVRLRREGGHGLSSLLEVDRAAGCSDDRLLRRNDVFLTFFPREILTLVQEK